MNDHDEKTAAISRAGRAGLRRAALARRDALPEDWRTSADRVINDLLWRLLSLRPAASLGFCWPIRSEVDCRPAVVQLLAAGWQAAMPVVVQADAPMEFRRWAPGVAMSADPHGIPVPAGDACPPPGLLLLPLVAYDAAGYRLGYGGGHFDRTLAATSPRPLALGIGYAATRLPSIVPAAHDIPLDGVVTEAGLECFAGWRGAAGDGGASRAGLAFPADPSDHAGMPFERQNAS